MIPTVAFVTVVALGVCAFLKPSPPRGYFFYVWGVHKAANHTKFCRLCREAERHHMYLAPQVRPSPLAVCSHRRRAGTLAPMSSASGDPCGSISSPGTSSTLKGHPLFMALSPRSSRQRSLSSCWASTASGGQSTHKATRHADCAPMRRRRAHRSSASRARLPVTRGVIA